MEFLSEQLVSYEYRDRLSDDLSRADLCRFLVAYISEDGLQTIGREALVQALQNEDSFGVSSLTCACGYFPLLKLQSEIGESPRLKYFMDPLVKDTDEPNGIALFHSKLVYLRLPGENKSVVYIGSHNWSGRALGPGRPRNVEASIRFEVQYAPEHLTGSDGSIASQVNRHLLSAYRTDACISATPKHERIFEQWYEFGCRNTPPSNLEPVTVILAVQMNASTATADDWLNLANQGIYLQALEEAEGKRVRQADVRLLVMVWDSHRDLESGIPPVLLRCRVSSSNAGPSSDVRGTNQSTAPMAGFGAAIFDKSQLWAMQSDRRAVRSSVVIWSGHGVETFDFEFRRQPSDSSQIDGGIRPKYQFHLEVDQIVFPASREAPIKTDMLWTPESFAVAKSKDDAKLERVEGYYVPLELRTQILLYLTEELQVDRSQAKVFPVSNFDSGREGKRISKHPLHDTFIGRDVEQHRQEFYEDAEQGSLVADIDGPRQATNKASDNRQPSIERVQKVFTTKLETLERTWTSIARSRGG